MRRKVLIVTTVSGFLYQFEKNAVEIWKEKGASLPRLLIRKHEIVQ